jgi:hypothetical protein
MLPLRFLAFPFVVIGMNAIAVYMITGVRLPAPLRHRRLGSVSIYLHSTTSSARWPAFSYLVDLFYMYRKRTFIKV